MGEIFLGLEGGGTRTVALAADADFNLIRRVEAGPCNLRLVSATDLVKHFRFFSQRLPAPTAIGIGLAGCRDDADRQRVNAAASVVWPKVPRNVSHDLETALRTADLGAIKSQNPDAQIVVISGTGSCCFGRNRSGKTAKAGGWGHLLGDRGSGYDLASTALREVVAVYDASGRWPALGTRFLRRLMLNEPEALIGWRQSATKTEVAALATEIFLAITARDRLARQIVKNVRSGLMVQALTVASRLAGRGGQVEFVLSGSAFTQPRAATAEFARELRQQRCDSTVRVVDRETAWGALVLAREAAEVTSTAVRTHARSRPTSSDFRTPPKPMNRPRPAVGLPIVPQSTALSPTETTNSRSMNFDQLRLGDAIELMLSEDEKIPDAIRAQQPALERLIQLVSRAFRNGGRLFYVGAGTSGRLGVLDASECPPTFRTSPDLVQGIMAGGERALYCAVEGAEDDLDAGAAAIRFRAVSARDVVLGIAASGRTPFVWGALAEARRRRATTALLCCNPYLKFHRGTKPNVVLAINVGAEILTGSTRLKSGTATKLALNLLTTLVFARSGKVIGNLMVDLNPSNTKLRERATRIVVELTGARPLDAHAALERSGWVVQRAVMALGRKRT